MAVVAGTAGEAFAAPEGDGAGALGETAAGVGGAEDGDDGGAGDAGEVEGAGVVGDDEVGGVHEGEGLEEGELADLVGDGEAVEGGVDPGVVGTADEGYLEVLGEEELGEGDVELGGPAAEGVVGFEVAGSGGGYEDAGDSVGG